MRIPNGPSGSAAEGLPTLHTSHIRTYGAAGFRMANQETVMGCPAQFKARYVDRRVTAYKSSSDLDFGTVIHDTLYLMEQEPIGPEEALERSWLPSLPPERWREARDVLDAYLARGGPMAKFGTLGTEVDLYAQLYDDEDFGPVWFGGWIDWLGLDLDQPQVLHLVDYKSNQFPTSRADVKGDVQLMGYDWLVRQNWKRLGLPGRPQVVVHLDSVRYSDVDWRFSEHDLDEWRDWAIAIARKILRDERAEEVLNPYCSWCPIKLECKTYEKLPEIGVTLLERKAGRDVDSLLAWSERAKDAVKQLNAGIAEVNEILKVRAQQEGSFESGGESFTWEPSYSNQLDKDRLIEVIGPDEYVRLSSVTKKALEETARGNPELKSAIEKCWSKVASGMTLGRKKVES